jgi:hypothetical protein
MGVEFSTQESGTAQGSVYSQLLGNVNLQCVFDFWFGKEVLTKARDPLAYSVSGRFRIRQRWSMLWNSIGSEIQIYCERIARRCECCRISMKTGEWKELSSFKTPEIIVSRLSPAARTLTNIAVGESGIIKDK